MTSYGTNSHRLAAQNNFFHQQSIIGVGGLPLLPSQPTLICSHALLQCLKDCSSIIYLNSFEIFFFAPLLFTLWDSPRIKIGSTSSLWLIGRWRLCFLRWYLSWKDHSMQHKVMRCSGYVINNLHTEGQPSCKKNWYSSNEFWGLDWQQTNLMWAVVCPMIYTSPCNCSGNGHNTLFPFPADDLSHQMLILKYAKLID